MADLGQLLKSYSISAVRLESLPQYKVSGEWENFKVYQIEGKILRDPDLEWYLDLIAKKEKEGASNIRIRVIDHPISSYLKYEYLAGYCPAVEKGSDVLFIDRSDYDEIKAKSKFGVAGDFWIFDSNTLVSMKYGDEGEWVGAEIVDGKQELVAAGNFIEQLRNKTFDMAHFSTLLKSNN